MLLALLAVVAVAVVSISVVCAVALARPQAPKQPPLGPQPRAGGIRRANVKATYHMYAPQYDASTTACADGRYGARIPWTAYCLGPWAPAELCGRCLRVKNRATGASAVVRIVDSGGCNPAGLDLDNYVFKQLDTDGRGYAAGHLMVDVDEVACV